MVQDETGRGLVRYSAAFFLCSTVLFDVSMPKNDISIKKMYISEVSSTNFDIF